jgi:hypothetical protein
VPQQNLRLRPLGGLTISAPPASATWCVRAFSSTQTGSVYCRQHPAICSVLALHVLSSPPSLGLPPAPPSFAAAPLRAGSASPRGQSAESAEAPVQRLHAASAPVAPDSPPPTSPHACPMGWQVTPTYFLTSPLSTSSACTHTTVCAQVHTLCPFSHALMHLPYCAHRQSYICQTVPTASHNIMRSSTPQFAQLHRHGSRHPWQPLTASSRPEPHPSSHPRLSRLLATAVPCHFGMTCSGPACQPAHAGRPPSIGTREHLWWGTAPPGTQSQRDHCCEHVELHHESMTTAVLTPVIYCHPRCMVHSPGDAGAASRPQHHS